MINNWTSIAPNKIPSTIRIHKDSWKYIGRNSKVLEVGCADGRVIRECLNRNLSVIGTDINKQAIKYLKSVIKNNDQCKILVDDICNTKIKESSVDFIFALGLLGSIRKEDRLLAIKNCYKTLAKKGIILIGEFAYDDKRNSLRYKKDAVITKEDGTIVIDSDENNSLFFGHHFKETELKELIKESNFKILKFHYSIFKTFHNHRRKGYLIFCIKP